MLQAFASGQIFGARTGTGTPRVLALHGWRRAHGDFDAVLAGFDAIAVDLPGFGASPEPPAAWGGADYAAAVAPVLDELPDGAVVLGHSFGGQVAVHLAATHPDRVKGLVLTGTPLFRRPPAGKPPLAFRLLKWANARGLVSDARMEAERRKRGSDDYRAATGVIRDVLVRVLNEAYDDVLPAIACPVELVWGDDDTAAPLAQAVRAVDLIPHATLTVVHGAGHFTPSTAVADLQAALRRLGA